MHRSLIKIGTFFSFFLPLTKREAGLRQNSFLLLAYTTYATACIILHTCYSLALIADESVSNANKFPLTAVMFYCIILTLQQGLSQLCLKWQQHLRRLNKCEIKCLRKTLTPCRAPCLHAHDASFHHGQSPFQGPCCPLLQGTS